MLSYRIGFREMTGPKLPIISLSFKFRHSAKASEHLFPTFSAPPYPNVSEPNNGVMSRLHHFDANKAVLLYFRLTQRERNCYFRQL